MDTVEEGDCVSSILPILIKHSDEVLTYAILDEQSDACFLTNALKTKLRVTGIDVNLEISTILDQGTVQSELIKGLAIRGLKQDELINLPAAYTREVIPMTVSQIPTPEKVNNWAHLQCIKGHLSPLLNVEVGGLIGATCPRALTPIQVIPGIKEADPYAVRRALGWGVIGVTNQKKDGAKKTHFAFKSTTREVIKVLERDFLDLKDDSLSMSLTEEAFKMVKMVNGHVQLPLPFNTDNPRLPNNREVAMKRLKQLEQKMTKQPVFAEKYNDFVSGVINKGQAEIVPDEELHNPSWYIPHHRVFHARKQDKLRVVMDCASRYQGVSLNDYLLQGPSMTNNLIGDMIRFRQHPIAVVGDIEGMFYQVLVDPKDRDFLRLLRWKDEKFSNVSEYRMLVHVSGVTSSPACANYALKKVTDMNEELYGRDAAEFVHNGFYVDDGLTSVGSKEEAVSLLKRTAAMLEKGGFRLHKFLSNSPTVLKALPEESIASNAGRLHMSNLPIERTLGVLWKAAADMFTFDATPKNKPATRRGILSTTSAIFDPLGLVSPYILSGRRILQGVCAKGGDWDEPVDDETTLQWNAWKEQLPHLSQINIEWCYEVTTQPSRVVAVELHHFSDASERGYGQCSYIRIKDDCGRVKVTLLMSKCRVAPLKMTTIPRLELVAATVSVKVATLLKKELGYEDLKEHFWTHSQVVLGYITNQTRRFNTFVANRVQQIRNGSEPEQWHYIESKHNPSDIDSRGADMEMLKDSRLWWHGPGFLGESNYEVEPSVFSVNDDDVEVRKTNVYATQVKRQFMSEFLKRFSSWTKAKRVARATCLIFMQKIKGIQRGNDITLDDLANAERVIVKMSQHNEDDDPQRLEALEPIKDENGLMRVGGRLQKSTLPREIKHPVILPNKGHLTKLIVEHFPADPATRKRYHPKRHPRCWLLDNWRCESSFEVYLRLCDLQKTTKTS